MNTQQPDTTPLVNNATTLMTSLFMKNQHATKNQFETTAYELLKKGVKTRTDAEKSRMIFSATHAAKTKITNNYVQECNGLILSMDDWKPLVVPPKSMRFNIDNDESNKYLHQGLYHIYYAEDGTCFNMYYFNDKWVISTVSGYDMNDVMWFGRTYLDIIKECLKPLGLTWESFTMQLDKTRCYSFGFKHPQFHKFFEGSLDEHKEPSPVYKIWFIQSVDLDPTSPSYLWASDKCSIDGIKGQRICTFMINSLRDLYKIALNSANDYLSTNFPCYGFILRSVNYTVTGFHSDLFIESHLMQLIRRAWYDSNVLETAKTNEWNVETMVTLSAFLDVKNRNIFAALFPQYKKYFTAYSTLVNLVTASAVADGKVLELSPSDQQALSHLPKPVTKELIATCGCNLLTAFKKSNDYNIATKIKEQRTRVLTEWILSSDRLDEFMMIL
jgi:hypothetical protein